VDARTGKKLWQYDARLPDDIRPCCDVINRGVALYGDLVFFGSRGSVTHVGIYVGEGRFVHAPSTGGTVRLDSLSGPYWKDHYTGAKRVLR